MRRAGSRRDMDSWHRLALSLLLVASSASLVRAQGRAPAPAWLHGVPSLRSLDEPVVIELHGPVDASALAALAQRGLRVRDVNGRPLAHGRFVSGRISPANLGALATLSIVARVHRPAPTGPSPLARSAERIALEGARGVGDVERLMGRGVLIADIDTAPDVFHPAFFHADAGWYDWIDVDGDGRFTPDVDGIDLDGDGVIDPTEVARTLPIAYVDLERRDTRSLRRAAFDPSVDWLYLDTNGNGERDFGALAGFGDDDPAFGEPLFVADDLDLDGALDPEERLVRLGTSKFRAVWVNLEYGLPHQHEYRRGVDLSSLRRDYTGGLFGYADTAHGSGVAGILVGDVPLVGRRSVGIAPLAEMVQTFSVSEDQTEPLFYVLGHEPDVVLHEYVDWTRSALDGSDAVSALIDASTLERGVTHVCPAGNIGGSRKHAYVEVSGVRDVPFHVPAGIMQLEISALHRTSDEVAIALVLPDGTVADVPLEEPTRITPAGALVWRVERATSRGFNHVYHVVYSFDAEIPSGDWALRVRRADGAAAASVDAFLSDNASGFSLGAAWDAEVATDRSTIAAPATADRCLGVGSVPSYAAADGPWYARPDDVAEGTVRTYSARGPRIDGFGSLGIVAPDNPWSVLGAGDFYPSAPGFVIAPEASYWVFGGTSGAGPHVAGVAALLVERGPLRGEAVLDRLRETAEADAVTGVVPNDDYGYGRLDASGALDGTRLGRAPTLSLRVEPAEVVRGAEVQLVPVASDPDGDALQIRWDDDYDGSWDTGYGAVTPRAITFDELGPRRFKARVRDASGRVAEAAILVRVVATPSLPPDAGLGDGGMGDAGGGGCGCRATGDGAGGLFAVLVALGLVRRRRRPFV